MLCSKVFEEFDILKGGFVNAHTTVLYNYIVQNSIKKLQENNTLNLLSH